MTLSKNDILERLNPKPGSRLQPIIITPLLDIQDQVGMCGIDLRLGKQFVLFNEHIYDTFDPAGEMKVEEIKKYQEEIVVPIREKIILHPGKLMIGCTLEYISIPDDIECQVEGRSSWSRLGLIIATATTVEPGFKGVVTLELSNTGSIPIKLYPGLKVAQIIFHLLSNKIEITEEYNTQKKYQFSIGPQLSRIYKDKDKKYFCR